MVVLDDISKSFPSVQALRGVDLTVERGQVHALLGENGSGKSTLVKVLAGVYEPDAGSITIAGERRSSLGTPAAAHELGIRVVHQEAPLVDTLRVVECVALFHGYPTGQFARVRWRRLLRQTAALFDEVGIAVEPKRMASTLTPAERALVSLAIALGGVGGQTRILVLDEATAALPQSDADILLERVASLAADGLPVLMVTHRLSELRVADQVTVLRDGIVVHRGPAAGASEELLVEKMVGNPKLMRRGTDSAEADADSVVRLWTAARRQEPRRRESLAPGGLEVANLAADLLRDVSFSVGRGEIVGVAGLRDSGIGELPLVLAGAVERSGGEIAIDGVRLPRRLTPRAARDAGIILVPADRLHEGGVRSLTLAENIVLPETPRYWHRPRLQRGVVKAVIDELDVRPRDGDAMFGQLSGGNQQKALFGKWLLLRPSVLVLDDATYGVDPGARRRIFQIIRGAAAEGVSVLLFSTEPEQLVATCSRVLVLRDGAVAGELAGTTLDLETLTRWAWA